MLIGKGAVLIVEVETIQFEVEMGDVDVLPAVAVDIGGIDAHAGFVPPIFAGGDPGNQRNIFERSIVFVDEQEIRPGVVGDRDVGPAIIIEVGQHHAHPLGFGLADAGLVAYVGEGSVVIVVVELGVLSLVVAGMAVGAVAGTALAAPHDCSSGVQSM